MFMYTFVHFCDLVTELFSVRASIQSNDKLNMFDLIEQPSETNKLNCVSDARRQINQLQTSALETFDIL
jgi:hypothetical protein